MPKRTVSRNWRGLALLGLALSVLCTVASPALAKKYKDKDLKGTYHYVVTEVRVEGPELQYCDSHGTIRFDGHGGAEVTMTLRRCTLHPSGSLEVEIEEGDLFDYEVFPNGEFLLIELDDVTGLPTDYVTHGRIVQKGDLLLVDGTGGCEVGPPPSCFHPEFLQTVAVAAKE